MLNFPTLRTWMVNHSPASRRCIWTTSWNWRWFETGWPAAIIETFGTWNIPQIALLNGKSGDKVWQSIFLGDSYDPLVGKYLFTSWDTARWDLSAGSCLQRLFSMVELVELVGLGDWLLTPVDEMSEYPNWRVASFTSFASSDFLRFRLARSTALGLKVSSSCAKE